MKKGVVSSIHIGPTALERMLTVPEARAVPGRGLEGDRYFNREGTYSNQQTPAREVTLIEMEALEALKRDYGIELLPHECRRNIVTRDAALNHYVGREFRVGEVMLRGIRLCEPCSHLEELAGRSVARGLVHRGGLRAQVVSGGILRVGDCIEATEGSGRES